MKEPKDLEVWFVTGSQHLYGKEALKQVDVDSETTCSIERCSFRSIYGGIKEPGQQYCKKSCY